MKKKRTYKTKRIRHTKDSAFKRYFRHKYIMKDLLNAMYYAGEQVIQEKDIQEMTIENVGNDLKHTLRDLLFKVNFGNHEIYDVCMIGIEGQSSIDHTMPIRVLNYDTKSLVKQMEECKTFTKDTKLIPPKTIVFNYSNKLWTAKTNVQDVLSIKQSDDSIINDSYKLIDIHDAKNDYVELLHTELQSVIKFLQRQTDEEAIDELLNTDERYQRLSTDGAVFLMEVSGIDYQMNKHEEKVIDMCEAWRQHREKGVKEGLAVGMEKGLAAGRSEGYLEAGHDYALIMLKDGLPVEKVAYYTNQSVETIQRWASEIQNS